MLSLLFFYCRYHRIKNRRKQRIAIVWKSRTLKLAAVELFERAAMEGVKLFLEFLILSVPFKVYSILTNKGNWFADLQTL